MWKLYTILAGIFLFFLIGINIAPSMTSPYAEMVFLVNDFSLASSSVAGLDTEAAIEPEFTAFLPETASGSRQMEMIDYEVPFTSQAPFGEWSDPRYQDACEESSVLMALAAIRGQTLKAEEARDEIAKMSDYEKETYGSYTDTSAQDTLQRLVKEYSGFDQGQVEYGIDAEDIKEALYGGNLVLVPTNGRKLGNPNYRAPGPERHMLVIRGYDPETDEFITNDPGTRLGKAYRYGSQTVIDALFDYPSGDHLPVKLFKTAMITLPLPGR